MSSTICRVSKAVRPSLLRGPHTQFSHTLTLARPAVASQISSSISIPRRHKSDATDNYKDASKGQAHIGFAVVPQQSAFVIERFGKFSGVLQAGLHFLIPVVDRIAYVHSLKEEALTIPNQSAITKDNVMMKLDGVLYVQIQDPYEASYGVEHPIYALVLLAQTTMRSELGKITLDKVFEERDSLNANIVKSISEAATAWGIKCLRYEIRDITPPQAIRESMELQAEAERQKRADITQSEGFRESAYNKALGDKQALVLKAEGEAAAIIAQANATAEGIIQLSTAMNREGGNMAMNLRVAEKYVDAFGKIAKEGNTMIIPSNASDVSSMVAQALGVYKNLGVGNSSIGHSKSQTIASPTSEEEVIDGGYHPTIPGELKGLK